MLITCGDDFHFIRIATPFGIKNIAQEIQELCFIDLTLLCVEDLLKFI